ncbi:MAG: archaellin/type IV pilin N-terminal domain-containing protein [Candidatus Bathyarchaeia archaeon]
MKILKSRKALSPVVAAIILIAVTVAVSIAVAAWMGALTVGFMGSSSVTITEVDFDTDPKTNVTLTVKNTGTKAVTIASVKVNNAKPASFAGEDNSLTIQPGDTKHIYITLSVGWTAGNVYKFDLYDGSGQVVGSYQATAPSS